MKPPKCRVCGKEHWLHEPHQGFTDAVAESARNFTSTDGTFDRNAYQREYMREYRKHKKGES